MTDTLSQTRNTGAETAYATLTSLLHLLQGAIPAETRSTGAQPRSAGALTTGYPTERAPALAALALRAGLHPALSPYRRDPTRTLGGNFLSLDARISGLHVFLEKRDLWGRTLQMLPQLDREELAVLPGLSPFGVNGEAPESGSVGVLWGALYLSEPGVAISCAIHAAIDLSSPAWHRHWPEPVAVRPISPDIRASAATALSAAIFCATRLFDLPTRLRPAPLFFDITGPDLTDDILEHVSGDSLTFPLALAFLSTLLEKPLPPRVGATGGLRQEGIPIEPVLPVDHVPHKIKALKGQGITTVLAPAQGKKPGGAIPVESLEAAVRRIWPEAFGSPTATRIPTAGETGGFAVPTGDAIGAILCARPVGVDTGSSGRLRHLLARHGGLLFTGPNGFAEWEGAVWAFFGDPRAACIAALAVQHAFQCLATTPADAVHVSVALHCGTVRLHPDNAGGIRGDGPDVEWAGLLMEAIPPGQTLATDTMSSALRATGRPADVPDREGALKPLGTYRLRCLGTPRGIYRLTRADWRTPRGVPAFLLPARHNLPVYLQPRIGREREMAEIIRLLGQPTVRAVTLTGNGGIGKTRLALEVAARLARSSGAGVSRYPDGVWLVPLHQAQEPEAVALAVAQAMRLRQESQGEEADAVIAHLAEKRALLVLDNGETAVAGVPFIGRLLREATGIQALITARTRLSFPEETPFEVLPFGSRAGDADTLSEAERFFRERARAAAPLGTRPSPDEEPSDTEAVRRICRRLGGLPLALEIAAAQTHFLSFAELDRRLEAVLPTDNGNGDRQSVAYALEGFFALLGSDERAMLFHLTPFENGFTAEAARAVSGGTFDTLALLEEKALVRRGLEGDAERYTLLPPVREFAARKAGEGGHENNAGQRHAAHFRQFAAHCARQISIEPDPRILQSLEAEMGNLRAAMDFLSAKDPAAVPEFVSDLCDPLQARGYLREWWGWSRYALRLLELGRVQAPPAVWSRLYRSRAVAAIDAKRPNDALEPARAAVDYARTANDPALLGPALSTRGLTERTLGQTEAAIETLSEARAIYRQAGSLRGEIIVLNNLVSVSIHARQYDAASQYCADAVALCRRVEDRVGLMVALSNSGYIAYQRHGVKEAADFYGEAVHLAYENGNVYQIASALLNLGDILRTLGETERAMPMLALAEGLFRRSGHPLHREAAQYLDESAEAYGAERTATLRREFGRRTLPGLLRIDPWNPRIP